MRLSLRLELVLTALTSGFRAKPVYDVAIVGAGAAGITLATTLAAQGRSVFLAEGGGLEYSARSQALYEGAVEGDAYHPLSLIRLRYFGGTTNHWGGVCRQLETYDFEPKAGNPDTGWPIRRKDLDPFAAAARAMLGIGPFPADVMLPHTDRLAQTSWIWSDPMRFGLRYRRTLADAANVDVLTNCNLVGFQYRDDHVQALRVRNWDGVERLISARACVLACGAMENARVLLLANAEYRGALGDQGGAVGRYWADHPLSNAGAFVALKPDRFRPDVSGHEVVWRPTRKVLESDRTLNACVRLWPSDAAPRQFLKDLLCAAPALLDTVEQALGRRLYCALAGMEVQWEQSPTPSNRLTLHPTLRDEFGQQRLLLKSRRTPLDRRTAQVAVREVARYLAQQNSGRVKLDDWILRDSAPYPGQPISTMHPMGGTRMSETPARGVVDRDCKVFGVKNLYVAGASVFPSGGFANPTYTIVQLAVRLAHHLNARLQAAPVVSAAFTRPG